VNPSRWVLAALLPACADLIGADFGDASLLSETGSDAADTSDALRFDVVAEEAAGPFDPSTLPGLALWLDATVGVALTPSDASDPPVAAWQDRSGSQHDAVPVGSGTNPPTWVMGALNGRAVVHFASAELQLLRSQWTGPGSAELTIFLVSRGYAESALRFQANLGMYPFVIFPLDVNTNPLSPSFYFYVGTLDGGAGSPTTLRTLMQNDTELVTARWQSDGTASTYRDGALVEQRVALSPGLPSGQPLYLGGIIPVPAGAPYFMDGDIAETLIYTVALDDMARTEVEGYLRNKWGL
jgi:hypothetical protein